MYYHKSYPENVHVEKKLNIFLDYFQFATEHIGLIDNLPLENHLSLIEKIIFQIEHNPKHQVSYIDNYLANPLLTAQDRLIKKFSSYERLKPLVDEYGKSKDKQRFVDDCSEFRNELEQLKRELAENAFSHSLECIIKAIRSAPSCPSKFIDKIAYHTHLLVSEFLFTGRTRRYVLDVINHIFNLDYFPYPANVTFEREEDRRGYYYQLTLEDHLRAVCTIYRRKSRKDFFVCKVYVENKDPNFEFKYHNVTFRSREKSKSFFSNHSNEDKERVKRFLDDKNEYILAFYPITYYPSDLRLGSTVYTGAVNAIREALAFVNHILNTDGTVSNRSYQLVDDNGKFQGFGRDSKNAIDSDSLTTLEENSGYVFLAGQNNDAKQHILNHESFFSRAILSNKPADFWHYLEIIISKAFPEEGKEVRDFLPSLLLINHLPQQKNLIGKYIALCFQIIELGMLKPERLGLTNERYQCLSRRESLSADELLEEVSSPFTDELVSRYINNSRTDYKKLKKQYQSLLTEAYEQRNAYQHAGYECKKAVIKLNYVLPRLVARFRWLILKGANVEHEISFAEILMQLTEEGEQLLHPSPQTP